MPTSLLLAVMGCVGCRLLRIWQSEAPGMTRQGKLRDRCKLTDV